MEDAQMPTPKGMSNKIWYVIGAIVAVLLIGWLATRGMSYGAARMAGANVDQHMDGSTTYSNGEGSVTVGGGSMPDNWPSDAPANYAGASIQYSGNSNPQTGKSGAAVVYTARGSSTDVLNYYKSELASKGWKIEGTFNANGTTALSARKDTRVMAVYIVPGAEGMVAVTAGIEL
ncbi:hypothetical protein HY970_02235 [Candidatus Kaiserbacteria bacterium]|nr:hypothetical protein [Candidatus Kaiserbacteria bacterium]